MRIYKCYVDVTSGMDKTRELTSEASLLHQNKCMSRTYGGCCNSAISSQLFITIPFLDDTATTLLEQMKLVYSL